MAESNDALLGRIAVHTKLISPDQLNEATAEQGRSGGASAWARSWSRRASSRRRSSQKLLAAQKQVLAKQAAQRARYRRSRAWHRSPRRASPTATLPVSKPSGPAPLPLAPSDSQRPRPAVKRRHGGARDGGGARAGEP